MDFSSDTSAPAHPAVLDALREANDGPAASYGDDHITNALRLDLEGVFETKDFDVWMCASGTAANALALSCFCPPTGAAMCHAEAHISVDERGAPEFFSGGGKLHLLNGANSKIDIEEIERAVSAINHDFVHETPAHVLSLTNLTESGAAYSAVELEARYAIAKAAGLSTHLDGARLGNALNATGATPAEMTWKSGVGVLCFGLTKTGAMGCELIMLFGEARQKFGELKARAKRSGHMPPKMRFLAAQARALLAGDLWLELSAKANARAKQLTSVFTEAGIELAHPADGNEVFAKLTPAVADKLAKQGAKFYPWPDGSYRFVCAWTTTEADVSEFSKVLQRAL